MSTSDFVCLLTTADKGSSLATVIRAIRTGSTLPVEFVTVDPRSFEEIPSAPWAYWAHPDLRSKFSSQPALEDLGFEAQIGLSTKDDVRFLRLRWEVDPGEVGAHWYPFAKGGEFARFWSDVHLVVNFAAGGEELKAHLKVRYPYLQGNTDWVVHPESGYFRPGLTYTRRTSAPLSVRVLPAGCIFSDMGRGIIHEHDDQTALLTLLAAANSRLFRYLVELSVAAGDGAARTYEAGILNRIPAPAKKANLATAAHRAARCAMRIAAADETSALFCSPEISDDELTHVSEELVKAQREIDSIVLEAPETSEAATREVLRRIDEETHLARIDDRALRDQRSRRLASYLIGAAFGRWDIRLYMDATLQPEPPQLFRALSACPPAMLVSSASLPAQPDEIASEKWLRARAAGAADSGHHASNAAASRSYPIRLPWNGILIEDSGASSVGEVNWDLPTKVREVLRVLLGDLPQVAEEQIASALGVANLREYISQPRKFFAEHLSAYSKSRRKAPIYWPLSTASGSFTAWLYYPRLTADTLFQVVSEHLEPKLRRVQEERARVEAGQSRAESGEAARRAKRAGELVEFAQELEEMKAELLRVALLPYKPNLNDGVQITAAPLWRLFRLPSWRKALEDTWKKLEKGEYDWAHLAYAIWPERVAAKSRSDRSLAIAHGLEAKPTSSPTTRRGRNRAR